jgi:alkylation response protein AidB-like acyl-CoA dehydrogenase
VAADHVAGGLAAVGRSAQRHRDRHREVLGRGRGHRVAHTTVRVHGGVGIDMDYPLHRYFAAAKSCEFTLGGATAQLRRIGAALASEG